MKHLVVISLERWDGTWRRNQHLLHRLLDREPQLKVLFVEPAADPLHSVRRGDGVKFGTPATPVPPGAGATWSGRLWTYQPTKLLPRRLDSRVDIRLARKIIHFARELGFRHPILWINDPIGAEVLRQTGWPSLYDITDDWLLAERSPAETSRLRRQEEFLMTRSDHVVVCSAQLFRDRSAKRSVQLIPNAVDLAAYREVGPRPRDLPEQPSALYVGTLHRDRLDIELSAALAAALAPEARLVFLGPDALEAKDRDRLTSSGAVLLGPRPSPQVPTYLRHAEILVVPHIVNHFTESLDPIKAYEYRAARRPVVSTSVPGFREPAVGVECVARSAFVDAVVRRIQRGRSPDLPLQDVPDWSIRVESMRELLEGLWSRQC